MWGRSPRRRLEDPGRGCEGQSRIRCFTRSAVMPRYSHNSRPPCRTRKSIRPALCRVSDRTVVRVARPPTLSIRPVRIRQASQGDKGTMKKKTAQPRRKQRKTSVSEKKKGLIAQKKTTGSSERAKSALDNRSHRTQSSAVAKPSAATHVRGFVGLEELESSCHSFSVSASHLSECDQCRNPWTSPRLL